MDQLTEWTDKYNPFNSLKALAHVKTWESVKDGIIPPPFFLSIDPSGICDLDCTYCNAAYTMQYSPNQLSIMDIDDIISLLKDWKVRAVCVGGGGEPLTNPHTGYLLDLLAHIGVKVGVVTNGTMIDRFLDPLSLSTWVGISVNSASAETHEKLFRSGNKTFEKILKNIGSLVLYKSRHNPSLEVTYKFLLHPNNFSEVVEAAKIAKDLGCNLIHIRPGDDPWFRLGTGEFSITNTDRQKCIELIEEARSKYEDADFKVYGVVHKFTERWQPKRSFSVCSATMVQCLISSSGEIELCCDRRGDPALTLCKVSNAREVWGSLKHIEMVKAIQVDQCPRCTYTHVNEIFENVVFKDRMLYDFI